MSNKDQADFFARLYDQEAALGESLRDRAKWYLSLVTVYSAAVLLVAEKLRPKDAAQFWIFALALGGMLASFLAALWAVRVAAYEGITDPGEALEIMRDNRFDETKFFLDRISDYVVATERNAKIHARQAQALSAAGYLLLAGMAAHGAYFTMKLAPGGANDQVQDNAAQGSEGQGQALKSPGGRSISRRCAEAPKGPDCHPQVIPKPANTPAH